MGAGTAARGGEDTAARRQPEALRVAHCESGNNPYAHNPSGAAGIFLEDQQWPKKCGHFDGKKVIPAEEHAAKLRAAEGPIARRRPRVESTLPLKVVEPHQNSGPPTPS